MLVIYANERLRRAAMPLIMKNPRTVGQKIAKHNGLSLSSVIKGWGGAEYMKPNGALTPLGRDEYTKLKAAVGLSKNASTEKYLAKIKERFSSFIPRKMFSSFIPAK